MSQVAISGNAAGTGVFTVASPNSNVDRVLTLPDESGTVDTLQRSGNVIQVVNFQTGAMATGTTVIPKDDTIPQITEGTQFMSLAITPTNASNILIITSSVYAESSILSAGFVSALFVGVTAGALASTIHTAFTAGSGTFNTFSHRMVAGVATELTFRVRSGTHNTGTLTFNGAAGARLLGGSLASSITITEYTP